MRFVVVGETIAGGHIGVWVIFGISLLATNHDRKSWSPELHGYCSMTNFVSVN